MLTFVLNKDKDADIIKWLDTRKNRSDAVRELIRREANNGRD